MKVYRMYKLKIIIGASLTAVAAILIAVTAVLLVSWARFNAICEETEGVIIDIRSTYNSSDDSESHTVNVEYIVDGKVYRRSLGYYSSAMRIGQSVSIKYDPDDPYRIMNSPYIACVILLIFFVITCIVGVYLWLSELMNKKLINRLAAEDKYIICDNTVERFEKLSTLTVNGVRYMQTDFIYHAPDGMEYTFSSREYHPQKNPFSEGQSVTVYVDIEKNPKKYYVHTGE